MNFRVMVVMRSLLILTLLASIALYIWVPFKIVTVRGESMAPKYHESQTLIATKRFGSLHVGQIVVISRDGEYMIKRVAALPGQTVTQYEIAYHTWTALDQSTPSDQLTFDFMIEHGSYYRTTQILPGTVWVRGDNRSVSIDSDTYGAVLNDEIKYVIPRT